MVEIGCAIIAAASLVIVAIVNGRMSRANCKMEVRAKLRQEESLLSMKMMSALGKLCVGTALAIKNGKCNGEMQDGLEAVEKAEEDYTAFQQRTTAYQVSK